MRVGFAVKVLGDGGLPSHDTRRWQSGPHLRVSLQRLDTILDYLDRIDVRMYRMPSAIAPYASHPDMPQFWGQIDECHDELEAIGAKARRLGIRLSTHPGQYTVLNSIDEVVVRNAMREVEVHAHLMEAMQLPPESVIVIHVGGVAEGKEASLDRFEKTFTTLSERAQSRLIVENDDRSFGLADVLSLADRIDRPVVWDILHHLCYDPAGIGLEEALGMALRSWPREVVPKIHFSSPRADVGERSRKVGRKMVREPTLPPARAHADLVDPIAFETFLRGPAAGRDFDIMLEAKAKDLALLRLREQMKARGISI